MSRSDYSYDIDNWDLIRWRGAVKSAIRGKRGQAFLKELGEAMDRMEDKHLISGKFEDEGSVCALGVIGKERGLDMSGMEEWDNEDVGKVFGIAMALAAEIQYMNDEWLYDTDNCEKRWQVIREWVRKNIKDEDQS